MKVSAPGIVISAVLVGTVLSPTIAGAVPPTGDPEMLAAIVAIHDTIIEMNDGNITYIKQILYTFAAANIGMFIALIFATTWKGD